MIYARVQSKDSTNQSIHWTHQYAVLDKVKNNLADPREPQKRISEIQLVERLPEQDVQNCLKNRWTVLVSRVICKYLKTFTNFQDVVVHYIPHSDTDVMSEKSSISIIACCTSSTLLFKQKVKKKKFQLLSRVSFQDFDYWPLTRRWLLNG